MVKRLFIRPKLEPGDIKQLFTEVEVNSTWLITSELANQRSRKVLFTCVVYTLNNNIAAL